MIAIKRLQSIMWILVVAAGALMAYLVSLRVATERNAVVALDQQIYRTRANIRYLEAEFGARASMRQLEAWNTQDIRYSTPTPGQFLSGESELASLDRIRPNGEAYVPPPVMAAMADTQLADATPVSAPALPAHIQPLEKPERTQVALVDEQPLPRAVKAALEKAAPAKAGKKGQNGKKDEKKDKKAAEEPVRLARAEPAKPAKAPTDRAARLALLDAKLLDDAGVRKLASRPAALALAGH